MPLCVATGQEAVLPDSDRRILCKVRLSLGRDLKLTCYLLGQWRGLPSHVRVAVVASGQLGLMGPWELHV